MSKKGVKLPSKSAEPNTKVVQPKVSPEAKALAILFHDTYERLAPEFGYETKPETRKFKASTPNGKLMIAVANEVLATQPKPAPEKPTDESFEKWFFKMDIKHFVDITQRWNEAKLKIKIVKQNDYDGWFNFFKNVSATSIRILNATGQDFLPADAYSALRRWADIISNPHRMDKIHQSGLTNSNKEKGRHSIVEMAIANDRLGVLKATRDQLAEKLEKGAGARDTAALTREMTEIMTQIADYEKRSGPKKTTVLGQLLNDMHDTKPRARNKGVRNTSFRSRVTIADVEK